MGQYYIIANADKKEYLNPWDLDCGSKLMEWAYNRTNIVLALLNKLDAEWSGNRVYVIGDYAEADNSDDVWYTEMEKLQTEFHTENIYTYVLKNFENVSKECDVEYRGYRYIYNHATQEMIDLEKCPVEWVWYNAEERRGAVSSIAPIPLLIAMGNGRGGGDFEGNHGYEDVGKWCESVRYIEVRKGEMIALDYKEYNPDFTENNQLIPYTEGAEMLKKQKEKVLKEYAEI